MRKISYKLEVEVPGGRAEANHTCDALIKLYDGDVEGSGVAEGRAFIRFRAENDEEAKKVIAGIVSGEETFSLVTGYGAHERVVVDGYSQS